MRSTRRTKKRAAKKTRGRRMRGGEHSLKNIFNYTHPTNAVKANTIDKLAKQTPDVTRFNAYDKLFISVKRFNESKNRALRIAIRKAIITKFPQYVTEDGVINYLEIVNDIDTQGVIPIPEFNYKININAQMRRIILIVPGTFENTYYTIYQPAHNSSL